MNLKYRRVKRMVLLNDNWRFHLGDEENSYEKFHKDDNWRKVTIPHDWSVEYPKREEYSSGTGYVIGGTAWYRKTFRIEGEKKKGRTFLTSFAGSIGIIGIALILSLSHGMQSYINRVEEDTLSSYPLTCLLYTSPSPRDCS